MDKEVKEKQLLKFELSAKDLKIKNLLNQQFLFVEIRAMSSIKPNLNGSWFTPEALRNAIPTFYNKPILAHFIPEKNDFGGHDSSELMYDTELGNYYYDFSRESEIPIGLIREQDKIEIRHDPFEDVDYVVVPSCLWVSYNYRACKKLLKNKNTSVSVEVEVEDYEYDADGIEVIKKFSLLGITLLGSALTAAIKDSVLTIPELSQTATFQSQKKKLQFAYEKLDKEIEGKQPPQNSLSEDKEQIPELNNDDPVNNENVPRISMDEQESQISEEDKEENMDKEKFTKSVDSSEVSADTPKDNDNKKTFGNDIVENPEGDGIVMVMSEDENKPEKECNSEDNCKNSADKQECSEDNKEECSKEECSKECESDETTGETFEEKCPECKETEGCDCDDKDDDKPEDKDDDDKDDDDKPEDKETESCKESEGCKETEAKEDECDDKLCKNSVEDQCKNSAEEECKNSAEDKECESDIVTSEHFSAETVEVNGENLDIHQLYAKFSAMAEENESLKAQIRAQANEGYKTFAKELIEKETRLFDDSRENVEKQVFEAIDKNNFASEDDVKTFAVSAMAMALFNQDGIRLADSSKEYQVNFSSNNTEVKTVKKSSYEKMVEAKNALDRI